ncbi:lysozyme, partial [Klebsiella pneumoniae]|nr:lysozyme [Klebsiella pneumoniae]
MKKTFALAAMMAAIAPNLASAADEMIQTKYACEGGKTLDVVYVGDYAVTVSYTHLRAH